MKMNLKRLISSLLCCHSGANDEKVQRKCFDNLDRSYVIENNLCFCVEYELGVEHQLRDLELENQSLVVEWFKAKCARSKAIWRYLLDEYDVDLTRMDLYMIRINTRGVFWKDLNEDAKLLLFEWCNLANLNIYGIFQFRKKMQSRAQRLKDLLLSPFIKTTIEFKVMERNLSSFDFSNEMDKAHFTSRSPSAKSLSTPILSKLRV